MSDRCTICGHVERPDEMRREDMNLVLICPSCKKMICDGCWTHHLDVQCGWPAPPSVAVTIDIKRKGRR